MKKNNLVVLIAFFLIFEIFLVSGVILDNNQDFNENQFSLDNREIISSSQNLIYDKSFLNKENFNEGDYSGYIIEFESEAADILSDIFIFKFSCSALILYSYL